MREFGTFLCLLLLGVNSHMLAQEFTILPLVLEGDPAPETGGGVFSSLGQLSLNDLGDVVFDAAVAGGDVAGGLFLISGEEIRPIAFTGQELPDGNILSCPCNPQINNLRHIAFSDPTQGIYLWSDDKLSTLLSLPWQGSTALLDGVSSFDFNDRNQVALVGSTHTQSSPNGQGLDLDQGLHLVTGETVLPVVVSGIGRSKPSISEVGEIVFVYAALNPFAIGTFSEDRETGLIIHDRQFETLKDCSEGPCTIRFLAPIDQPSLGRRWQVVFVASVSIHGPSLFLYSDKAFSAIAYSDVEAPDSASSSLSSSHFGSFHRPLINNLGAIVFGAALGDTRSTRGIFIWKKPTIHKIVGRGDVPPKTGGTFVFSDQEGSVDFDFNNLDALAFKADIEGGSSSEGIFLAVPNDLQELYFAQFGHGSQGSSSLSSEITLLNSSTVADVNALVEIRDDEGAPLEVEVDGRSVPGKLSAVVPRQGSVVLRSTGESLLRAGSVTITSAQKLSGVILFRSTRGLAGVPESRALSSFTAPVQTDAEVDTGLAIMGLSEAQSIDLELRDKEGNRVATAAQELPPNGHVAKLIREFEWDTPPDFSSFSGVVEAKGIAPFAATVILVTADEYATLPVVETE